VEPVTSEEAEDLVELSVLLDRDMEDDESSFGGAALLAACADSDVEELNLQFCKVAARNLEAAEGNRGRIYGTVRLIQFEVAQPPHTTKRITAIASQAMSGRVRLEQ
jgi:hypothetical protein